MFPSLVADNQDPRMQGGASPKIQSKAGSSVPGALDILQDLLDGVLVLRLKGRQLEARELEPLEPHEAVDDEAGGDIVVLQQHL